MRVVVEEQLPARAAELGAWLLNEIHSFRGPKVAGVRGKGLLIGIELTEPAQPYCKQLLEMGVLCRDIHGRTIRIAPPLVTSREDLAWLAAQLRAALSN